MSLDPTVNTKIPYWNYGNKNKENYTTECVGRIVSIQLAQAAKFGSNGKIGDTYPDGNPKLNVRVLMCTANGDFIAHSFSKASKKSGSDHLHIQMWEQAKHLPGREGETSIISRLIGKTVKFTTKEGQYDMSHPRPFTFEVLADTNWLPNSPIPENYTKEVALYPTAQPQPQPQPMQQMPQYQQPMGYQQPMQQPMQQMPYNQNIMQQMMQAQQQMPEQYNEQELYDTPW